MDPSWSETGDRYLLKLFRDYVFHQVDENNDPVLNLAHVVSCLNKVRRVTGRRAGRGMGLTTARRVAVPRQWLGGASWTSVTLKRLFCRAATASRA